MKNLLTERRLRALEKLPLDRQCDELGLPLTDLALDDISYPEIAAFRYHESQGYKGASCEGGLILTVIKALCLDRLSELNYFRSRDDACTRFLEAQFTIFAGKQEELFDTLRSTTPERLVENFEEIYKHPFVRSCYPGLDSAVALELYKALGPTRLERIARKIAGDPYLYRKGWPDLTLVRSDVVKFVEVKIQDKLRRSQLITIPAMRDVMEVPFSVLRLWKA